MPDKHPPNITVQKFTREQKQSGQVPGAAQGANRPEAVIMSPAQAGSPPSSQAPTGEPVSSDVPESAPPTQENVPNLETGTPDLPEPETDEVIIKGTAAIALARMLGLEEVWNIETGEVLPLYQAVQKPFLAVIDFNALRESIDGYDPNAIEDLMGNLPERVSEIQQQRARDTFVQPPAGPGVTVKQIPGLIKVSVEGPVRLRKSKQGNTRILQVSYHTVEAQPKTGRPEQVTAGPTGRRLQNTHDVRMRPRTVPRQVPQPEPEPEPQPGPEHMIDEDYEF